jgi:hypothetical protein
MVPCLSTSRLERRSRTSRKNLDKIGNEHKGEPLSVDVRFRAPKERCNEPSGASPLRPSSMSLSASNLAAQPEYTSWLHRIWQIGRRIMQAHLASAIALQLQLKSALWNFKRFAPWRDARAGRGGKRDRASACAGRRCASDPQRGQAGSLLDPNAPGAAGDEDTISAIDRALAKLRLSASQARERAAALCDETTATLFARLAGALDRQIWFLRSSSR